MTNEILVDILIAIIGICLSGLIISNPFLGVVFIAASLPVAELLPSVRYLSSILPVIGAVAILGYLLQNRKARRKVIKGARPVLILGALFIFWIFITNPAAAWFGEGRNWMLTYLQLIILSFLAEELVDDPQKQHIFIWVFSIAALVSAAVAIRQGSIGEDIDTSIRTGGLSEGANSAGRYFVVGMIFFVYLRIQEQNAFLKVVASLGVILTFLGVFYTVSRSAMILLFTAIGLIILLDPKKKLNLPLIILFLIATLSLTFLSETVFGILGSILPSISKGTDTIGLRYKLWSAGLRMWLDHPITGVGIGRFPYELPLYGTGIAQNHLHLVAHSTYVQLLSETGIVGLLIWLSMGVISLMNIWKARHVDDLGQKLLAMAWFTVFLVLLIGALTMTQSSEKLIWICMGIGEYFHLHTINQPAVEKPAQPSSKSLAKSGSKLSLNSKQ